MHRGSRIFFRPASLLFPAGRVPISCCGGPTERGEPVVCTRMCPESPIGKPGHGRTVNTEVAKRRSERTWHMQPTMAQTEEESAPPDSGSRNPAAPDLRAGERAAGDRRVAATAADASQRPTAPGCSLLGSKSFKLAWRGPG